MSNTYQSVFLGSTGNNKKLLETYYLKYQVHNLMALLRCKKADEKNLEPYLIGDGRRKEKYIKAWEMPIEDAIIYLTKKLGFEPDEVLENYRKSIYDVENYLYKVYYEKLKSVNFKFNNRDERKFIKFITLYIDLLNARSYLRVRNETQEKINYSDFFLPGGNLSLNVFENLNSKSINVVLEELQKILNKKEFTFDSLLIWK